jgi:hypothetical protein
MPLSLDGTTGISASGNITGGNVIASGALIVGSFTPLSVSTVGNVTGGNILTGGLISATGAITSATNVIGGNLLTAGLISATGAITTAANITLTGNIVDTAGIFINTGSNGNICLNPDGTGAILVNKDILNGQAAGTGNIGSAGYTFNTIFAKATSAQYADLAEMYLADATLHSGTVVEFGGTQEITICSINHSPRVAGIISTRPSHLMNATLSGEHAYPVALTGRVPCTVIGLITKGDCLVSSDHPGAARRLDPEKFVPGCIVGKALQDHNSESIGIIEVAVGRF